MTAPVSRRSLFGLLLAPVLWPLRGLFPSPPPVPPEPPEPLADTYGEDDQYTYDLARDPDKAVHGWTLYRGEDWRGQFVLCDGVDCDICGSRPPA